MNYGVIALMAPPARSPHSGPERPVRDPCVDRGGLGLGLAEDLSDGDQVPRGQRYVGRV
jgi:hypothetical protein